MSRPSKAKQSRRKNVKKAVAVSRKIVPQRKFTGIAEDSQLISPPLGSKRCSVPPAKLAVTFNQKKRNAIPTKVTIAKNPKPSSLAEKEKIKWRAVCEYFKVLADKGCLSNDMVQQIADDFGIGHYSTLRKLVNRAMTTSNVSKTRKVTRRINHAEVNEFMKVEAAKMNYHFTHACMLRLVTLKFGCGSKWLIDTIFKEYDWQKVCSKNI